MLDKKNNAACLLSESKREKAPTLPNDVTPSRIIGQAVKHEVFGKGKIIEVNDRTVKVNFGNLGTKMFFYPDAFTRWLEFEEETSNNQTEKGYIMKNNVIDLSGINPQLAEGIREIIEYDRAMSAKKFEIPKVNNHTACFKIMKGTTYSPFSLEKNESLVDLFENISGMVFCELGYDFEEAIELCERIYQIDENSDEDEIMQALREFDELSCFLAKRPSYPTVMIDTLFRIDSWLSFTETGSEIEMAILYILSFYDSLHRFEQYSEYIEEAGYTGYETNGLMTPRKRKFLAGKGAPEIMDILKMMAESED